MTLQCLRTSYDFQSSSLSSRSLQLDRFRRPMAPLLRCLASNSIHHIPVHQNPPTSSSSPSLSLYGNNSQQGIPSQYTWPIHFLCLIVTIRDLSSFTLCNTSSFVLCLVLLTFSILCHTDISKAHNLLMSSSLMVYVIFSIQNTLHIIFLTFIIFLSSYLTDWMNCSYGRSLQIFGSTHHFVHRQSHLISSLSIL